MSTVTYKCSSSYFTNTDFITKKNKKTKTLKNESRDQDSSLENHNTAVCLQVVVVVCDFKATWCWGQTENVRT